MPALHTLASIRSPRCGKAADRKAGGLRYLSALTLAQSLPSSDYGGNY